LNKTFCKDNLKIAAFDVDGTIFHDGVMNEAVESAILRLAASGVTIVLATGRLHYAIPKCIEDLGVFKYGILANGALIWDFEKNCAVKKRAFEGAEADRIVKLLDSVTDAYFVAFESESVLTPRHLALFRQNVKLEVPKDGSEPKEVYSTYDNLIEHIAEVNQPIFKIGCRFETVEECSSMLNKILEARTVEAASTGGKDIEITPLGVNKGSGGLLLCEHLGMDISNIIAFGDSGNDVDLLKIAGYGVVVDSGLETAKAVADYIAPTVQEDGVAKAIEELFGV